MPLKIIIIGGGLVGLTCAAALRRYGHQIKIFEHSAFVNEAGAAISVPPNVMTVLRLIEADEDILRPVHSYGFRRISRDGRASDLDMVMSFRTWSNELPRLTCKHMKDPGLFEARTGIKTSWYLSHRSDFHACLLDAATRPLAGIVTPELCLSTEAVAVDAEKGMVTLKNGATESADLVIGADGLHSISVSALTGRDAKFIDTQQNCFRFLVPVSKVVANPQTRSFMARCGTNAVNAFFDRDRGVKCMAYPCRAGELLNFVVVHPASYTNDSLKGGWHSPGSVNDLDDLMASFFPQLREVCAMAEGLTLWSLATKDPPSATYHRGKLVLVGDAAHHTLAHYGQGAAQGIEDAGALGVLLDQTATPETLNSRLAAWNDLRYPRATAVAIFARVDASRIDSMVSLARAFVPGLEKPNDFIQWLWEYDAVEQARKRLAKITV